MIVFLKYLEMIPVFGKKHLHRPGAWTNRAGPPSARTAAPAVASATGDPRFCEGCGRSSRPSLPGHGRMPPVLWTLLYSTLYTYLHIHTYTYIYICMYVWMYVFIYLFIYLFIYYIPGSFKWLFQPPIRGHLTPKSPQKNHLKRVTLKNLVVL